MRILAVDDDELVLEILSDALAVNGHTNVVGMSSGDSALELMTALSGDADRKNADFDCILLDIQMPGTDGIEVCRRIRKMPQYLRTPIIMITSLSSRDFVTRAFSAGATDYVTKPFDELELKSRIMQAEELMLEQQRRLEHFLQFSRDASGIAPQGDPNFLAPVPVRDVTECVDYRVLENYYLRLSEGKRDLYAAIALRPMDAAQVFEKLKEDLFSQFLRLLAEAVQREFEDSKTLFSHIGSGILVFVVERKSKGFSSALPVRVRETMQSTIEFAGIDLQFGKFVVPSHRAEHTQNAVYGAVLDLTSGDPAEQNASVLSQFQGLVRKYNFQVPSPKRNNKPVS